MKAKPKYRERYLRNKISFAIPIRGLETREVVKRSKNAAEMEVEDATKVGYLWSINAMARRFDEGINEAARILKARCEEGAIAACAMYNRLGKDWIRKALGVTDRSAFDPYVKGFEYLGEDKVVDKLEERWRDMPEDMPGPVEIRKYTQSWENMLEERVGRSIPHSPKELSEEEKEKSRKIARELGKARETVF